MKVDHFLCCVLDTQLWAINNARVDVIAQSVFYKMGYSTLADHVQERDDNENGGKKQVVIRLALPRQIGAAI